MHTYKLITAEPGYPDSATVERSGLSADEAVRAYLAARRRYRYDPENQPSHGEIRIECDDHEVADEDLMYGRSFEKPNPAFNHDDDYVHIRRDVLQRAKGYANA